MQGSARKDVVFGAAVVYPVTVPGPKWKSWLQRSNSNWSIAWKRAEQLVDFQAAVGLVVPLEFDNRVADRMDQHTPCIFLGLRD